MTRHGYSRNKDPVERKLYGVWGAMKNRCYRKKDRCYASYGGRGIVVCDEWLHDYTAFRTWAIENGYKPGLTIDRINVNGNYEPNNCRWATNQEQAENTSRTLYIEYKGEVKTVKQWAKEKGWNYDMLRGRIKRGWSAEKALETPQMHEAHNKPRNKKP